MSKRYFAANPGDTYAPYSKRWPTYDECKFEISKSEYIGDRVIYCEEIIEVGRQRDWLIGSSPTAIWTDSDLWTHPYNRCPMPCCAIAIHADNGRFPQRP